MPLASSFKPGSVIRSTYGGWTLLILQGGKAAVVSVSDPDQLWSIADVEWMTDDYEDTHAALEVKGDG